ncbi:hypothetical protein G7067_07730 [Leucobacter insecticola]|uniref:Uncharacterized protein n=1 Tax=Leucobacter insecticola TaxID=2714934 RepID=A0A6G8FJ23_9MICO|nr:hypothetical protein [Leucobacter insecticola]QIM16338.1 hypothetical protein G7067_07730 [Leucobacter insecticola]
MLEAAGVTVSLDGFTLLPETSLTLEPGSCVAVRGANGAEDDLARAGMLGATALLVATVSLQSWTRGLAVAAEGVGSPVLLPSSPGGLLARHLIVPFGLAAVSVLAWLGISGVLLGALWAGAAAGEGNGAPVMWAVAISLAVISGLVLWARGRLGV